MNLQMEINSLKQRISELEQQAEQEKEFPQVEDDYWCVNNDTEVLEMVWYGDQYDQGRSSIGNVFKTKKEAHFAVEKLKVEAELRKFSRPFKDKDNNYYIEIYLPNKKLSIDRSEFFKTQGTIYFESKKIAQQAIEAVGEDRIKKYIFGVGY